LLGLAKGTLKAGADADVTVFDPAREWHFVREESVSKSRNTPFHNWPLKGRAMYTIVRGQFVWREESRKAGV